MGILDDIKNGRKLIDFHVHMGKSSSGKLYTANDLITVMKEFNIEKSALSILNGIDTRDLNNKVNEIYINNPNKIVPFAYINPREPWVLEEVKRCLGDLNFKGIKFHSWKHGYSPDNNYMIDRVIDEIEKYNVPILTHTGTAPLSLPQSWANIAKKHPNVIFVFAHIGYLDYGYSCVESVENLKNVYVDTSGQVEVQILEMALERLGAERIIFSTDWPYKYHKSEICKLDVLNLSDKEKDMIFYENAKKLFEMEE